ncbi:MAG: cytochrome C oxidase subunit IV family protein [Gloeobacteraceae cyanobacterium ES-bin-144]|nr:cytochrome C oxidase subunit IV family protein [Verrucomicrobiales bacterium]
MADTAEEVRKSVRLYLFIGAVLFAGTILTVLVATLPALDFGKHGFDGADCLLGLLIAGTKATLVAAIFMHLNHEKKAVYWIFFGSFIFVAALYLLTKLAKSDPIHDPLFYGKESTTPPMLASPSLR